jgi:hypothetical protein
LGRFDSAREQAGPGVRNLAALLLGCGACGCAICARRAGHLAQQAEDRGIESLRDLCGGGIAVQAIATAAVS